MHVGEAGQVPLAQVEGEGVGDHGAAPDVHAAMVVHLPDEAPPELDGLDLRAESAGEHAIDHTLHAMLE